MSEEAQRRMGGVTQPSSPGTPTTSPTRGKWQRRAGRLLLCFEVIAALIFAWLVIDVWTTRSALNQAMKARQEADVLAVEAEMAAQAAKRTPAPTYTPRAGAAGPGEVARTIQIPAIDVHSRVYAGLGDEQLRKGVAQMTNAAVPGRPGNLIFSAHNDIYGEIFRHLDRLRPGDEVYIFTDAQRYTYVVRDTAIVEPTASWVIESTGQAMATLISCYPYLIDQKRIVVFADLVQP